MNKIILFKQAIETLLKEQAEQNKIRIFNKTTQNNIASKNVSLSAIKGHDIVILEGSYVCEMSKIDSYSYVGYNTLISKTTIGRYCSIASNVNIGHGEHLLSNISSSTLFLDNAYEVLTKGECIISDDVWIGVGATIKRGINIGVGAVVGANSFVNKNVPPFAIVAGSPAKIIRFRFQQDKIDRILESKWWEYDLEEAKKIIKELEKAT